MCPFINLSSFLVLITGGSGYIGSALTKHLLLNGWRVRILELSPDAASSFQNLLSSLKVEHPIEIQVGDACNSKDVSQSLQGVTHVVHLAGIANIHFCRENPQRAVEVNGMSVRNFLECARSRRNFCQFIYPSTVAGMYTLPSEGPIVESANVFPVDDYGISKQMGEQFCRAYARVYGIRTVIFRQSNVYGPSPRMKFDNVVHKFAQKALAGEPLEIYGSGKQERDFLYLDDLVRTYEMTLLNKVPPGREYNICNGMNKSISQVAEEISRVVAHLYGKNIEVKYIPINAQEIENHHISISSKRANYELGIVPQTPFEVGVQHLIESMECEYTLTCASRKLEPIEIP